MGQAKAAAGQAWQFSAGQGSLLVICCVKYELMVSTDATCTSVRRRASQSQSRPADRRTPIPLCSSFIVSLPWAYPRPMHESQSSIALRSTIRHWSKDSPARMAATASTISARLTRKGI